MITASLLNQYLTWWPIFIVKVCRSSAMSISTSWFVYQSARSFQYTWPEERSWNLHLGRWVTIYWKCLTSCWHLLKVTRWLHFYFFGPCLSQGIGFSTKCVRSFQYDDEENASCFNYQFNGASKTCFTCAIIPVFFLTLLWCFFFIKVTLVSQNYMLKAYWCNSFNAFYKTKNCIYDISFVNLNIFSYILWSFCVHQFNLGWDVGAW